MLSVNQNMYYDWRSTSPGLDQDHFRTIAFLGHASPRILEGTQDFDIVYKVLSPSSAALDVA